MPAKQDMAKHLQFARAALLQITGHEPRDFFTYESGNEHDPSGISVLLPSEEAFAAISPARQALRGRPLVCFSGTRHREGFELVVGPGHTQWDMLRLARTTANERQLDTEQIIERLSKYDEAMQINIYSAESDTVIFQFERMPDDLRSFVRDLKDLCPEFGPFTEESVEKWRTQLESDMDLLIWWD